MIMKRLAFCALLTTLTAAHAADLSAETKGTVRIAVVAAKSFPIDNLSFGDLKRLYMGNRIDSHGKRLIALALQNRSPERTAFDSAVLGMNPDTAALYWVDRRIRGESGPPKAIDSPQVLQRVVEKLDGALGYVRADAVAANVKVLSIDGKRPTDPGYPL